MKESKIRSQRRIVYDILKDSPQTTKMLQVNTGIPRENITRYIATLEKAKKVTVVKKASCEITKHSAKYYSSEQKYFEPETQSELFGSSFPKHAGVYSQ
jgi:predicted transcriptional regulator